MVLRGSGRAVASGVDVAGEADVDDLLLDGMAPLGATGAGVDRVAEVEAAADRVALDDLDAHRRLDGGRGASLGVALAGWNWGPAGVRLGGFGLGRYRVESYGSMLRDWVLNSSPRSED